MKICIVAEGSYPYITGGVSSWIHQLISNMPEHDFILISLMPENNKKGDFLYKLPANVIDVKEFFLDELLNIRGKWNKKIAFSPQTLEQLSNLLSFSKVNWNKLFEFLGSKENQKINGGDIQMSLPFYRLMQEAYINHYTHIPFTKVYWSLRSMYRVMFQLLLQPYPLADVYHAVSTGYAGFIASIASYANKRKFILTEHGIYTREREEEIIKSTWIEGNLKELWINYFYQISDCAYTQADKVISLFEYNKDIQIEIGCPMDKIEVIPNGVNVKDFEKVALEVSRRTGKDGINVGAVVRVVPIKDIITMLEAFSIVNKSIENINFYIMGPTDEDPEYYQECRSYRDYLGLYNVSFTGVIDIKEQLKKMDILVLTSISEGQPLVILEGLACKLPFVATNVGDAKSLILGVNDGLGAAGKISNVMDSTQIALDIIELCTDNNLRRNYGESGFVRVNKYYRFDRFIDRYKELYKTYGQRE